MKAEQDTTDKLGDYESLNNRLADMNRLQHAVWVYDFDNPAILWGNPQCTAIWQAESLTELRKRDLASGMTETVSKRLFQYKTDFLRPCFVKLYQSIVSIPMLCEVQKRYYTHQ